MRERSIAPQRCMLRTRVPEVERSTARARVVRRPGGIGCGSSGTLRVTKVAVSTQKPGNLALYLDVRDNGRPVAGLQEKDFRVYEDGKLVPAKKGKRALLDADVVSANFAIVQVDLSGPIADSEYLPELAQTVAHFAQDLNDRQEVAVNAFDGNDEVAPFLAFGAGKEQFRKLADGLAQVPPAQPQLEPVRRRLPGDLGAGREARQLAAGREAGDVDRVHRPRRSVAHRRHRADEGEAQGDAGAGLHHRRRARRSAGRT